MRGVRVSLLAAMILGFVGTLSAAENWRPIPGDEVAKRTDKVMTEINWVNDLDKLQEKAQKENKLIFWMQIVGKLDGGL